MPGLPDPGSSYREEFMAGKGGAWNRKGGLAGAETV